MNARLKLGGFLLIVWGIRIRTSRLTNHAAQPLIFEHGTCRVAVCTLPPFVTSLYMSPQAICGDPGMRSAVFRSNQTATSRQVSLFVAACMRCRLCVIVFVSSLSLSPLFSLTLGLLPCSTPGTTSSKAMGLHNSAGALACSSNRRYNCWVSTL